MSIFLKLGGDMEKAILAEASSRTMKPTTLIRAIITEWMLEHQWKRKVGRPHRVIEKEE